VFSPKYAIDILLACSRFEPAHEFFCAFVHMSLNTRPRAIIVAVSIEVRTRATLCNIGFGDISEVSAMMETSSKTDPTFDALRNDLAWLQLKWSEYRELFGFSEDRVNLLNRAAGLFFGMLQMLLWDDVLLHLCRMTDRTEIGDKTNLTIQMLPDFCDDPKLREDVSKLVTSATDTTKFARDWRNRRIAHNDLALALGEKGVERLEEANRLQVSNAISAIHAVLNYFSMHVHKFELANEVAGPRSGALGLVCTLKDGLDARESDIQVCRGV
jgi:hypothetical protein